MAKILKKDMQENAPAAESAAAPPEAKETPEETVAPPEVKEIPEDAPAPQEATEGAGKVIYVGPSIRGTILHTFTVLSDGIPDEYREHPTLRYLFVLLERLEEARQEIGRTGSLRNTCYKRAVEEFETKEAK
jgi:hypothetical protein